MKKPLILLLCAVLLLSACAADPQPLGSTAGTEDTVSTPEQTASAEAPTEPPTEAPTEAPTEPAPKEGSRTAGGVWVHTDSSAYTPGRSVRAKYTRLSPEPLLEFVPSEDYGAVYPYQAAWLYGVSWGDWEGSRSGRYMGLTDASGRILTDAIYGGVSQLSTEYYWDEDQNRRLPYWRVEQFQDNVVTDEEGRQTHYGSSLYGLISRDGSFALPCVYTSIYVLGDGFVCVSDDSGEEYEVYGPEGELLFTQAELQERFGKNCHFQMDWGDGLYLIRVYNRDWTNSRCWFCDETAQPVLGPYSDAGVFVDGLACVEAEGGFGYIDKTGQWVIEPIYEQMENFRDGIAIQSLPEEPDTCLLLNREGEIVARHENVYYAEHRPYGIIVDMDAVNSMALYNRAGQLVYSGNHYAYFLDENTIQEQWTEKGEERTRIFRPDGTELLLEGSWSAYRGLCMVEGQLLEGYYCDDVGLQRRFFIYPDLSGTVELEVRWSEEGLYPWFSTRGGFTEEEWQMTLAEGRWWGKSSLGRTLSVPAGSDYPSVVGDRVLLTTEQAFCQLDLEGNVLFCYPLDEGD